MCETRREERDTVKKKKEEGETRMEMQKEV